MEKELINKYESICNEIVEAFSKKQDLTFGHWIGDTVGGIVDYEGGYTFSFDDIVLDLKQNCKKDFIKEWYNDCVEFGGETFMNYNSYIMGLRYKDL